MSSLFSLKPPPLLASFLAARIPYLNIRKKKIIIKEKRDGKKGIFESCFFSLPLFFINGMNGLKIVMARKEEREERLIRESLDVCFRVEEGG